MDNGNLRYELYKLDDNTKINALIQNETIWLTQKAMGELFHVSVATISRHLKNIFEEGELEEEVVITKNVITTPHGAIEEKTQDKLTNFYNLDAIISVGYRVNSLKATRFRQWATSVLREYIIKQLEREISSFFDYIERLIERRNTFKMEDFAKSIDNFLEFNEYKVLPDHCKISMKQAKEKAFTEYSEFDKTQKINSDFEREFGKLR